MTTLHVVFRTGHFYNVATGKRVAFTPNEQYVITARGNFFHDATQVIVQSKPLTTDEILAKIHGDLEIAFHKLMLTASTQVYSILNFRMRFVLKLNCLKIYTSLQKEGLKVSCPNCMTARQD
jgi:hypothetical protein